MSEGSDAPRSAGFKRGRSLKNRRSVQLVDRLARGLITVGGIGTILAVLGVAVFLVAVVQKLFVGAEFRDESEPAGLAASATGSLPLRIGSDEFGASYWRLDQDGQIRLLRSDTGEIYRSIDLGGRSPLTAVGGPQHETKFVLGYRDGTVRLCDLDFVVTFVEPEALPPAFVRPGGPETDVVAGALVQRLASGRFRRTELRVDLGDPIQIGAVGGPATGSAGIIDCDRIDLSASIEIVALTRSEGLGAGVEPSLNRVEVTFTEDLFSGARRFEVQPTQRLRLESERMRSADRVRFLDAGRGVIVLDSEGRAARLSLGSEISVQQHVDLIDHSRSGRMSGVSSAVTLLGDKTLVVGHRGGGVSAWFLVSDPNVGNDQRRLIRAKEFELGEAPITALATSARGRSVLAGDAEGVVRVLHITTEQTLGSVSTGRAETSALAFGPKSDRAFAVVGGEGFVWDLDLGHPEVSLGSIFAPVAYEGRDEPAFAWQTSAASDSYESKYSLIPLVFGTIKATFYTMLLSIPLALLAAIYTSEFLSKQRRARIKPMVEMMASLPSVVLGFVAAVVLAPFIEDHVSGLVACVITVPLAILGGAFLWQSFPLERTLPRQALRVPLMTLTIVSGLFLGLGSNDWIEVLLFDGDLKLWLSDSSRGSGLPGWLLLTMPISAMVSAFVMMRVVNPAIRRRSETATRQVAARRHLMKWGTGSVAFLALSFLIAALCYYGGSLFGGGPWDLREGFDVGGFDLSPIGVYDQRNAMVVGFVMGFAVVPIIYTIAEDALSSVPENLRAASLGAGASPWQTAVRVVLPTAASGLFSAIMIGLGRAVGETMIVLMAAGNTPIMELNVFQGFQTLSAGIATELPEAPAGSTHYRTLFLAALVLFTITFVINSFAEGVRQHFRRKFSQL